VPFFFLYYEYGEKDIFSFVSMMYNERNKVTQIVKFLHSKININCCAYLIIPNEEIQQIPSLQVVIYTAWTKIMVDS
jgi:hypothetical protein